MFHFLVQDILGWQLIEADDFTDAWAIAMTNNTALSDYYSIDAAHLRRKLIDDGYLKMSRSSEFPTVLMISR